MIGMRSAIGETEFEMQQILGYAPIEPDGSFKLTRAGRHADRRSRSSTRKGRAFQTHTNWIQVRPGERRTCDGCHSPRRGGALNSGAVVNTRAGGAASRRWRPRTSPARRWPRRAPASTRPRCKLVTDLVYTDYLGRHHQGRRHAPGRRSRSSTPATPNPADDLATPAPVNGIINYPDHIEPLWTRNRGANTCTSCHNDPDKLDLSATHRRHRPHRPRTRSCMLGDPLLDPVTGLPLTRIEEGVLVIVRGPALVDTDGQRRRCARPGAQEPADARSCPAQTLMSGADARTAHPNPPATAPDHSKMLNAAEKRLLAEWMDLGGKYYNDPFDPAANVRTINGLSEATFATGCPADPHYDLRRGLPPGHRQSMSDDADRHLVPQQPLRAHRRREGRLQRDADDDLQRLQRRLRTTC